MIRVLVVDDQALIRTGFRMMLDEAADIEVVGEAVDGVDAIGKCRALRPDVALMDVRMPSMDGIAATGRIVRETATRVLILTTFDLDEYAYAGLRAGASGFLLKDALPDRLFDAVRAVAAGDAALTPRITRELVAQFAETAPSIRGRPASRGVLDALTAREREVFGLLADGLTNAEVARAMVLSEATVKTHVTRILSKLGLRDRVQVVIHAYENGLR